MRQVLDKQQKQMAEDYQWLRQEEKSLVSGLELGAYSSCTLMKVLRELLQLLRLLFKAGKASFPRRNSSSSSQTSCTPLFSAPHGAASFHVGYFETRAVFECLQSLSELL